MNSINIIFNSFFDIFFYPFRSVDSIYGLCAISLLTAIIALPIFKYTSNQEGIKRVKARIMGHILELRLFKDDIRIILSAQKNILKFNMIYLRYTLKPLMFMMVPMVVIVIHTALRYEYRPLHPGESAIVKVKLHNPNELSTQDREMVLTVSEGLSIETPPLQIDGGKETYWRVRAEREGIFKLGFQSHDMDVGKRVLVSGKVTRLSSETLKSGIINSFLNPGEPSLPEGTALKSVLITYPHAKINFFGWDIHWLILFFIFTLGFGFILMRPFNVRL
ncbi:MAG: hypothetical protein R2568_09680 [Candidatus Scalindua sp.]|jgi:hypothetical protein|nr:hypothetical protein [Candidatus Scalindua sp.]MDV5166999.1 hypothetical protein [Candidatus Scalindua sp.]